MDIINNHLLLNDTNQILKIAKCIENNVNIYDMFDETDICENLKVTNNYINSMFPNMVDKENFLRVLRYIFFPVIAEKYDKTKSDNSDDIEIKIIRIVGPGNNGKSMLISIINKIKPMWNCLDAGCLPVGPNLSIINLLNEDFDKSHFTKTNDNSYMYIMQTIGNPDQQFPEFSSTKFGNNLVIRCRQTFFPHLSSLSLFSEATINKIACGLFYLALEPFLDRQRLIKFYTDIMNNKNSHFSTIPNDINHIIISYSIPQFF